MEIEGGEIVPAGAFAGAVAESLLYGESAGKLLAGGGIAALVEVDTGEEVPGAGLTGAVPALVKKDDGTLEAVSGRASGSQRAKSRAIRESPAFRRRALWQESPRE